MNCSNTMISYAVALGTVIKYLSVQTTLLCGPGVFVLLLSLTLKDHKHNSSLKQRKCSL